MREKVGKSRNTVFFQWFEAPGGRKVSSLKRRVRSQLARWEMKKCTPLWRRSTFPSQNVQSTPPSDHFWKLRCRKSARRCGAKHISKSKCTKHTMVGPLLEVERWKSARRCGTKHISKSKCTKTPQLRTTFGSWDVEKVHAVVARSTFPSQNVKKHQGSGPLLDVEMSFRVAGARDCRSCRKWAKREGFVAIPKSMAGMGLLKRICKDAFSVAGAVQKTCSWEMLGGQGAHFLRGVAFWSIRSVGLLRWFCVTGAALRMTWHQFFVAGAVL